MSQVIIVDVGGETAGILVGSAGRFRFFSSQHAFDALDGRIFQSPEQASRAAAALREAPALPRVAA